MDVIGDTRKPTVSEACSQVTQDKLSALSAFWRSAFDLESVVAATTRHLQLATEEWDGTLVYYPISSACADVHQVKSGASALSHCDRLSALEKAVDDVVSRIKSTSCDLDGGAPCQTRASVARAWDTAVAVPTLASLMHAVEQSVGVVDSLVQSPSSHVTVDDANASPTSSLFADAARIALSLDELERQVVQLEQQVSRVREVVDKDADREWQTSLEQLAPHRHTTGDTR